jgi:hypothetical protein
MGFGFETFVLWQKYTFCLDTNKWERGRAWPQRQSGASKIVSKQNVLFRTNLNDFQTFVFLPVFTSLRGETYL